MGGMICTIDDFAKYMSFLLSSWPARNEDEVGPVKRNSAREMQQPWKFRGFLPNFKTHAGELCPRTFSYGFGLGWRLDCHDNVAISHSGGLPGFGSVHKAFIFFCPITVLALWRSATLLMPAWGAPAWQALDTLVLLANLKKRVLPVSPTLKKVQDEIVKTFTSLGR